MVEEALGHSLDGSKSRDFKENHPGKGMPSFFSVVIISHGDSSKNRWA
jgi:hypothetical protein